MSNLVATPGQSPDFNPRNVQTVQVRDLGATEIFDKSDEIDLREIWQALQRRKKLVALTAPSSCWQHFSPPTNASFAPFTGILLTVDHRPDKQ